MSTFLLLLTWISPCFLPLFRSNRRLQVFSYSALRQSGLAICNFGVLHCAVVWRSGLIHCWDSSFFNVTASLCGKEQIPIQRDGAGLSELTAEWTHWFGNCLLVSYVHFYFLFFGPSSLWKVGLLLSDYFYMFNLASFHMRKLWSLADADLWSHVAPECTLGANWVLQLRVNSAHLFFKDGASLHTRSSKLSHIWHEKKLPLSDRFLRVRTAGMFISTVIV